MKCDLCKHQDVHSESNLLCGSCAEMIQRLFIVQQRMDFFQPNAIEMADAESTGSFIVGQWL